MRTPTRLLLYPCPLPPQCWLLELFICKCCAKFSLMICALPTAQLLSRLPLHSSALHSSAPPFLSISFPFWLSSSAPLEPAVRFSLSTFYFSFSLSAAVLFFSSFTFSRSVFIAFRCLTDPLARFGAACIKCSILISARALFSLTNL